MNPQDLPLWLDVLLSALVITGAFFALVGSFGLVKLSTFLRRLHGPTKATTLGVGCVLIVSSIWFSVEGHAFSAHEFLITLFLFLTAPVSAHMLAKTAMNLDRSERPAPPRKEAADRKATKRIKASGAAAHKRQGTSAGPRKPSGRTR